MRKQTIVRHKLLFSSCHILNFHLWPFIAVQKRDACTQLFGGLELPGDFCRGERVIDAVAEAAQFLDLCERVGTAFLLCDDDVDVYLAAVRYCVVHRFASARDVVDQFAKNDVTHRKTKRRQRKRPVAYLRNQIVVAAAAGDCAKFSSAIECLENNAGVVSEAANNRHINLHEITEATNAQSGHEPLQFGALATAFQGREHKICNLPMSLCSFLK